MPVLRLEPTNLHECRRLVLRGQSNADGNMSMNGEAESDPWQRNHSYLALQVEMAESKAANSCVSGGPDGVYCDMEKSSDGLESRDSGPNMICIRRSSSSDARAASGRATAFGSF